MNQSQINPRWLRRLHVENFKRFDTLDLEFQGLNLLVGPNNSGKSTVLQACALFNFCYQVCLERRNGSFVFQNRTFGPDEFITVPAAEPKDLWRDRRVQRGNQPIPILIRGESWSGDVYEFEILLRFNRFAVQSASTNIPTAQPFSATLIPGYTGFWPREERRTAAVRRDMRAQAQHGGIVRNLLLDLKEDPTRWDRFVDELAVIFPNIHLLKPEFNEQADRYIRVGYTEEVETSENKRLKSPEFDLFAGGSGFHQFIQILAGILVEDATTVLLDEPDAHLFSKLQADLFAVMNRLVESGIQIIAATHSTDLVAAAHPSQLITFANSAPRRLQVYPEVLNIVSALGGLENLALLLIDAYHKVIVVENKSDANYLRMWMNRILGPERYKQLQRRLVFLYSEGRPNGEDVTRMLNTLKQAFGSTRPLSIRAFVVADRDYALDETLQSVRTRYTHPPFVNEQTWRIWQRTEIENYLLQPAAIVRAVTQAMPDLPLLQPQSEQIVQIIEDMIEATRDDFRKRMINVFGRYSQANRKGWEPATITERAEAFVEQVWHGDERFVWCDAKERVLPRLREDLQQRFGIRLSDQATINAMDDDDIPADLREAVEALASFVGEGIDH
jgi:predicted ATPase